MSRRNFQQLLKTRRRELRRSATPAEVELWKYLRRRQVMGLRFRRQHSMGPYIMDFYCPEAKLCIELDGPYHDHPEQIERDVRREKDLKMMGVDMLRFKNHVVFENPEVILESIKEHVRKWSIREY
ncbi:MAG: endonuclease domain-containing protein [Flavobacteriales bacterium]|nr:endonuclease domain-containing protein [Flavobacteriales bacterium]